MSTSPESESLEGIAVVGMAGRFPGAANVQQFWQNLRDGVESISFFEREQLAGSVDPALLDDANYVRANGVLEEIEMFDAEFFGFSPREAEMTDPQQRLFLECAWEALEDTGYDAEQFDGLIGVYAGAGLSTYLLNHVLQRPELFDALSAVNLQIGNTQDYVPTRVSYKLNLKGPSISVNTACSSSLVAIHVACQSLLDHHCDLALAGGVGIHTPQQVGYLYVENGIGSPDGHCRPFDAAANGTVNGNGLGIVALKRLADAVADGDTIRAVILGSAVNNDGSAKIGFTAPSIDGQATVIAEALAVAEVHPESIGYVEAHGTGTSLGDPIELSALNQVFRSKTTRTGFCGIGSVKSNIGHLDEAAGVAGFIKTVLALQHQSIPPSLHYKRPNPEIDFAGSPFFPCAELLPWQPSNDAPRRAGVSSFGIGGTNAHVVLEEPPPAADSGTSRAWQIVPLSAKTSSALEAATAKLADFLKDNPGVNLADVAYTLQRGRRAFDHRRFVLCREVDDAVRSLRSGDPARVVTGDGNVRPRPVAFMFPGQGSQYVNMGREFYGAEPVFTECFDRCADLLLPHVDLDLRTVVYPVGDDAPTGGGRIDQTAIAQPALFVVEYALAQLWMSWGVDPQAMIGHSIGEYVAACLSGVMPLEDALMLVAARGKLMQQMPAGAMSAVALGEEQLQPLLQSAHERNGNSKKSGSTLSLAASNAPEMCVVSGPIGDVERFESELSARSIAFRRLKTSHAFHSEMMQPVIGRFTELVQQLRLAEPKTPWLSNLTGGWITAQQATDPRYWADHLRHTVRFSQGVQKLVCQDDYILLEVGPGQSLSKLVKRQSRQTAPPVVLSTTGQPLDDTGRPPQWLKSLGELWLAGCPVQWEALNAGQRRRRLPLPTYPFERQRYWIDPKPSAAAAVEDDYVRMDIDDWYYVPSWKRTLLPYHRADGVESPKRWLVFVDGNGLGDRLAEQLRAGGHDVMTVVSSSHFDRIGQRRYALGCTSAEDYRLLAGELRRSDWRPESILHLWSLDAIDGDAAKFDVVQHHGFYSLLYMAQALVPDGVADEARITVVSSGLCGITGSEPLQPAAATMLGLLNVLPQEYPNIRCRNVDVVAGEIDLHDNFVHRLLRAVTSTAAEASLAISGTHYWKKTYEHVRLAEPAPNESRFRDGGVYLITGGLGGIGMILADHLARTRRAKLVLVGRRGLPDEATDADPSSRPIPARAGDTDRNESSQRDAGGVFQQRIALAGRLESEFHRELNVKGLDQFAGLRDRIDRLCASYVHDFFRRQGVDTRAAQVHSRAALMSQLKIRPQFEKFFDYFLRVLSEDGIVSVAGGDVTFVQGPQSVRDSAELRQALLSDFPEFAGMLNLLDHCVSRYPEALSAEIPAISVLYPDGESKLLDEAGRQTASYSFRELYVRVFCESVRRWAAAADGTQTFRILEVGAGDGLLTRCLAPLLGEFGVEYVVTDLGRTFVAKLRREAEAAGLQFMQFKTLDIASDPCAQGFDAADFDVVVGLDVVHATADVGRSLANLKKLLAPGGVVALIETVQSPRWTDLIWGLAEGWWYFEDRDLRPASPLMDLDRWQRAFQTQGFPYVEAFPRGAEHRTESDYGLILGQSASADRSARLACAYDLGRGAQGGHGRRVEFVRRLREAGSEVLVRQADVGDERQMAAVVAETRQRFGRIDGVIHAAGVTDRDVICNLLPETGRREVEALYHARARGARVLAHVLRGEPLDFCALISSNASTLGGLGFSAYAAACAFLDALATQQRDRHGLPWISTNWDSWPTESVKGQVADFQTSIDRFAMTREQAVSALERTIRQDAGQLVVSAGNLQNRLKQWIELEQPGRATKAESKTQPAVRHPRRRVGSEYVPPRNATEQALVDAWQDLLGIDRVGVDDNFFELDGDSLLGTQLIARIGRQFGLQVPFRSLFEDPTVAGLARRIETIRESTAELLTVPAGHAGDDEEEGEL